MKLIFILFLIPFQNIFSQSINWFPLAFGNEYQFNSYDSVSYPVIKIERDTVYPNGKKYFALPYNGFYFGDTRTDSSGNVLSISRPFFGNANTPENLMFKANAKENDVWIIADSINPLGQKGYGKCIYDDSVFLFGKIRKVKGVLIYSDSYYYYWFWLAEGIGLVRDMFDDGTVNLLNYANINGVIYGNLVTDIQNKLTDIPKIFSVSQNYPNPFNGITNIKFSLSKRSFVYLKVFDSMGREIATLVSGELIAGKHTIIWNASEMSSGVYFYRLQTGTFSETKKLILLK